MLKIFVFCYDSCVAMDTPLRTIYEMSSSYLVYLDAIGGITC